jgi:SAM-dependent methyltransferase
MDRRHRWVGAGACALALTTIVVSAYGAQHDQHQSADVPGHMEHRFANAEAYAKVFDSPARDAWQMPDRVISTLDPKPGTTVADIGAGTGYFAARLAKSPAAPRVYGVDIEPAMVEHLKARSAREHLPNLVPVLASAASPNLPAPVDLVLVVDTYHHIADRVTYFRTLQGSLKPGARLAVIDFRKESPEGPPPEFRFPPEQITKELQEAGFRLVARHDFLPRQHFLVYEVAR